ncbi:hypothetical protein [Mariniblastus fucicola]|uniref:Uncharacterized protein n=1 Tax=Mariniblastus fucicola TaxID=980251 RepID=A0A5B9PJA6_9BACT|nr:hypothetical protein [Mariniblastus fucicola]QEG24736.1 hypothetical protein MFFC18_46580 [Mariniblastus fucicola]
MPENAKKTDTFKLMFTTLLYAPCTILAKIASQTRVNEVTIEADTVTKCRNWHAEFLRIPGNLILGFRRAPVKVLSTKQWFEREQELAGATVSRNALQLKKLNGKPLCELLAVEVSAERKLAAISVSMRSLFEFHLQFDQSHGDASATNVMIDELPNGELSASWFDFDVAHRATVSEVDGRADDLRALFFTARPWLSNADFARLFTEFNANYADDDVWQKLIETMSNPFQHCDVFHLAQQRRAKDCLNHE